jgi:tetratricopeptide (TPR) repeat protein
MQFRFVHSAWFIALVLTAGCGNESHRAGSQSSRTRGSNWFEDFTARAGVRFVHQVETSGRYLFSESIGSGAAFLDFDNDGRLDLYLIHNVNPSARATNSLYHQQTDGSFKDVSAGSGLDVVGYGNGVAAGDVNNDGFPEVLVTEYDRVRLFLNHGGRKFTDITAAAGITNEHWSVPAAFVDYDRDGWLDLVVGNYLDFDPTQKCPDARGQPDFCGPRGFHSTITRLFRNLGREGGAPAEPDNFDGARRTNPFGRSLTLPRFEDVTVRSGISRAPGKAMQIVCADFDDDHWPDLFITDDGLPNRLFVNQRNGTFKEEAVVRGLAYTGMGAAAANMGIALGDADGDGMFDVFVPHLAEENHTLWRQGPRGLFQDVTARAGLLGLPWHGTGFGAVFADFDADGALDLAVINGLVRRRPGRSPYRAAPGLAPFWTLYAEPSQLFANGGDGHFQEISSANPALCGEALVGRGLACGDFDNDGAPDLILVGIAGPARLLRNVAGPGGHWLGLRAIDPALGNRDAYGAEILLQAGGRRWWRLVQPAYSYASSNDPRVQFGLGPVTTVESIQVRWPDGLEEAFPGGPADRYLTLRRGSGTKTNWRGQEWTEQEKGGDAKKPDPPVPLAVSAPLPHFPSPQIAVAGLDPAVARLIESALQTVRAAPQSGESWGKLGSVLVHYDFMEETRAAFARAEALSPDEPRWPHLHGLAVSAHDAAAATEKFRRATTLGSVNGNGIKGSSNDVNRALPLTDPSELRLAQMLAERGLNAEAEAQFQALLRVLPAHPPALLGLARLRQAQGRLFEATNSLAGCLRNPHTARSAHVLLAAIEQALGNATAAAAAARAGTILPADVPWPDPWWTEAQAYRVGKKALIEDATTLMDQGRLTEALAALDRVTREYPQDEEAWYLLGWALNQQTRAADAERALREHLRLSPQSPKGHAQLAVALLAQRRHIEAVELLQAALKLKPTWRELHSNLGYACVQLGRDEEAITHFRDALALDPNYLPSYAALAQLLDRQGARAEAQRFRQQALELKP